MEAQRHGRKARKLSLVDPATDGAVPLPVLTCLHACAHGIHCKRGAVGPAVNV